jgi:hypothetical protein
VGRAGATSHESNALRVRAPEGGRNFFGSPPSLIPLLAERQGGS